jgi:hypothetical protein
MTKQMNGSASKNTGRHFSGVLGWKDHDVMAPHD